MEETGITVHTQENAEGVTEVLGIEDDDSHTGKDSYKTVIVAPSESATGEVGNLLMLFSLNRKIKKTRRRMISRCSILTRPRILTARCVFIN
jgi:hypothetical protein